MKKQRRFVYVCVRGRCERVMYEGKACPRVFFSFLRVMTVTLASVLA